MGKDPRIIEGNGFGARFRGPVKVVKPTPEKEQSHHARDHAIGLMRSLAKMYPKEAKEVVESVVK